ncbi:MAG TPA: hypothetical protein VID27_16000 [Blastocatellia bacterium]|jgi:hypothetical protein
MELKITTLIALILTSIYLLFDLIIFANNYSFYFQGFESRGADAALNLLFRLAGFAWEGGLIFFFAVLYSKQKQQ